MRVLCFCIVFAVMLGQRTLTIGGSISLTPVSCSIGMDSTKQDNCCYLNLKINISYNGSLVFRMRVMGRMLEVLALVVLRIILLSVRSFLIILRVLRNMPLSMSGSWISRLVLGWCRLHFSRYRKCPSRSNRRYSNFMPKKKYRLLRDGFVWSLLLLMSSLKVWSIDNK